MNAIMACEMLNKLTQEEQDWELIGHTKTSDGICLRIRLAHKEYNVVQEDLDIDGGESLAIDMILGLKD